MWHGCQRSDTNTGAQQQVAGCSTIKRMGFAENPRMTAPGRVTSSLLRHPGGFGVALIVGLLLTGCQGRTNLAQAPVCDVYFSPRGGCTEQVVKEIDQARQRILVQ